MRPLRPLLGRCPLALALAGSLALVACGGSDSPAATSPGSASTSPSSPAATDAVPVTDAVPATDAPVVTVAAGAAVPCDQVLTLDEVAGLFGEPAMFVPDSSTWDESLGRTMCMWKTIEDPNDTGDVSGMLVSVTIIDGSTVPGASFYSPQTMHPAAQPLDIGDQGYVDVSAPDVFPDVSIGWVDGVRAGFVSWSAVDLDGSQGTTSAAFGDATVAIARLVFDRVG